MFATDRAPGVHYQTVDAGSLPVTPLRTDIAGFVGIAERGPVDVPVPVESWQQFVSWFGGCRAIGFLAYSVRAFFENGGRRCWVVRIASDDALRGRAAAETVVASAGGPVWRVAASSPGRWGNRLRLSVRERTAHRAYTLRTDAFGAWSDLSSLAGFERGTLVRVSQPGSPTLAKVVSGVDAASGRLYWVNPETLLRFRYDSPLIGHDPDRPTLLETVDYRLLVTEDARLLRVVEGVSLVAEHARYGPALFARPRPRADAVTGRAGASAPEPIVIEDLRADLADIRMLSAPVDDAPLLGGRDGLAALQVFDFIGEPAAPEDSPIAAALKLRGLRTVESLDEVALLSVPDIHVRVAEPNPVAPAACVPDPCLDEPAPEPRPAPDALGEVPPSFNAAEVYRVQSAMVEQCEHHRDRFALLDPPYDVSTDPVAGIPGVLDWRSRFDTAFASLTYPWVAVADPVGLPGSTRLVPPSGHTGGICAATDIASGVHHAPAGRPLEWAIGASVAVGEEQHGVLNTRGVNVLRTVAGRGLRLLGARTTSSDPDWRPIPVRRLMSMIEKALGIALQWAVFEPNGLMTRARATMSVTFFLEGLHEAGALAGSIPEESFYVKCDLDNNPPAERDIGRLLIEVGVAPVQPLEFIVLRIGRVADSIQVRGGLGSLGATGTEG
jgi:phage tail sheath protein FI